MFSTKEYLEKKTGPYGVGRFSFLQSLVTEFQESDKPEAKEQVLANLANFAYDPINYEYLRQLNVVGLFLDTLDEPSEKLVEYAIGGLCNLCLDKQQKEDIIKSDGITLVVKCLSSSNEETVVSAITTLMFLVTPGSKAEITSLPIMDVMLRFSKAENKRLSNLATVFIEDYCTEEQVKEALQAQQEWEQQQDAEAGDGSAGT